MPRNNEIRSFNILSDGEDHHLIHRYQQTADPQALRVLVDRHLPALRRLLFTLLDGCREDMENAEQETLLAAARELPGFRFKSSFSTWLYRIGRNRALDLLRRRRRRGRRLERAGVGRAPDGWEAVSTAPQPAPSSVDPEAELLRRECAGGLLKTFQALSPPERILILLRDLEGQTIFEIADVLGWPARTVKSRLHRAQEKLAGRWQENAAVKPDPICRWARTTLQEIRYREAGNPAILDYDLMRHLGRCPWCRGFQKFLHHFGPQLRREVERRSEPPAGSASALSAERIAGLQDAPRPLLSRSTRAPLSSAWTTQRRPLP